MYVPRAGLHIRRARMHMLHAGLDIDVPVCIRYVLGLQSDVLAYGSMYMLAGGIWRLADAISRL